MIPSLHPAAARAPVPRRVRWIPSIAARPIPRRRPRPIPSITPRPILRRRARWIASVAALLIPFALRAQEAPATAALRDAVQRSHPALAARRAALEAARARAAAAGFADPATLSAEVEEVPDGVDLTRAAVRVELGRELVSPARRNAARAFAAADVRAAEATLSATSARVDAALLRALTAAAGWTAIARRLAAEDSLLVSAQEALTARFALGEARYVDVLRLRTERLRVQNDRAASLAQARIARAGLEGLVASSESATIDAAVAETEPRIAFLPPPPDADSLLARAGAILVARAAVERARADRAVTAAGQRTRVTGAVGLQRFGADEGAGTLGITLGGSMTLPATARRANRAALAAADAQVVAAQADADAALASVRTEIAGAMARYESARIRLSAFDAGLLRGAREEREAALASFRAGELTLIELLDFERALAQAETERLRGAVDAADALADLHAAGSDHDDSSPGGNP